MSKGSSPPRLTVVWNSTLRLWLKKPQQDGFFELLEPYSETWPPSGSMRSGCAWPLRRSALPTPASGSSSSRGRLLPTPRTSDTNGPGLHGDGGPDLRTAISLLPTPIATDFKGSGATQGRSRSGRPRPMSDADLPEVVSLLPTPTVADSRDTANFRPDGTPYGSGYGMTLTDATRLLPTPRASDGAKGGPNQRGSSGDLMLPSAVSHLLPTPTASDGERTSSTYGRGNPTLTGASANPPSAAGNPSSAGPHPGQPTLWDA